jgi:hypothetical protein
MTRVEDAQKGRMLSKRAASAQTTGVDVASLRMRLESEAKGGKGD